MRSRTTNPSQDSEINITPMLDVVFIMLIFFIVTTSFTKETGLSVFKASKSPIQTEKTKTAVIKLDINNQISVNGISASSLEGIEPLIANLKAQNPDLSVHIISNSEVKTDTLVQAIQQVKLNDIAKYSVSSF
ncbi:MAG: biopolymer transporter ExbD [Xanthomonadales bacterium]|nr:biopolymer transporter ExbD [Xanthomonadales bacterium]